MKISAFDIYRYSLALNQPLMVRGRRLPNREGLILHLKSGEGIEGFGEVAPLPGFCRETLSDACHQIKLLQSSLCGQTVPEGLEKLDGQFDRWLSAFALNPSVRFGVESAVLHLLASARKIPLCKLLSQTARQHVRVTGLLNGPKDQAAAQTRALIARGFTELKLKVGGDVGEAAAEVQAVNDAADGRALLRLDANQAWDFDQAVTFGKAIGCAAVNYIEEPFKDTQRIPEFFDQTMIPVALDESLPHLSFDDIKPISGVEILVLKPTALGGIEKTRQMINKAENFAIGTVISSSFESSLGIWTLANLAGSLSRISAAGLDTLKWFKDDVLKQPVPVQNGAIRISEQTIQAKDIDFGLLMKM